MKRGITAFGLEPIDLVTSIEVAGAAGYDAVELRTYMVASFLAQGHTVKEIVDKLESVSIWPNVIGAVQDIDMPDGPERDELFADFRRTCEVMREIKCPGIQVCSGDRLASLDWPSIRKQTARTHPPVVQERILLPHAHGPSVGGQLASTWGQGHVAAST